MFYWYFYKSRKLVSKFSSYPNNHCIYTLHPDQYFLVYLEQITILRDKPSGLHITDKSLKINLEKINLNDVDLDPDETKLLKTQFDNFSEISLTNKKPRFSGIDARIIKKCKELSKMETSSSE